MLWPAAGQTKGSAAAWSLLHYEKLSHVGATALSEPFSVDVQRTQGHEVHNVDNGQTRNTISGGQMDGWDDNYRPYRSY